jgi:hypothetical protein
MAKQTKWGSASPQEFIEQHAPQVRHRSFFDEYGGQVKSNSSYGPSSPSMWKDIIKDTDTNTVQGRKFVKGNPELFEQGSTQDEKYRAAKVAKAQMVDKGINRPKTTAKVTDMGKFSNKVNAATNTLSRGLRTVPIASSMFGGLPMFAGVGSELIDSGNYSEEGFKDAWKTFGPKYHKMMGEPTAPVQTNQSYYTQVQDQVKEAQNPVYPDQPNTQNEIRASRGNNELRADIASSGNTAQAPTDMFRTGNQNFSPVNEDFVLTEAIKQAQQQQQPAVIQEDVVVPKEVAQEAVATKVAPNVEAAPKAWTGSYGGNTLPEQFKDEAQLKEWQTLNSIGSDGLYGDESSNAFNKLGGNNEGYQNYLRDYNSKYDNK